ncbi:MAG: pyruvate kinase [Actinoplanes sp.]
MKPRIIATIGHGSHHDEGVRAIVAAGAGVLRYNAATMKTLGDTAQRIADGRRALGDHAVPVMVDLPFPRQKLRLHTFAGAEHDVPRGETFRFVARPSLQSGPRDVLVEIPTFTGIVEPGEVFIIGDGELAFRADAVESHALTATAVTKWYLSDGKSIHLSRVPNAVVDAESYLAEVLADLGDLRPEYLAFSFVESGDEMRQIRALLDGDWRPRLIAKVETPAAMRELDGILDASDLVLFARGDMAIQAPYEMLGLHQKRVVSRARAAGIPVIVATQVLETTMTRYVPNRSEILDLTNIVLEGAWGVMLAKETSAPDNPVYPVTVAKRIIDQVAAW